MSLIVNLQCIEDIDEDNMGFYLVSAYGDGADDADDYEERFVFEDKNERLDASHKAVIYAAELAQRIDARVKIDSQHKYI